jgi:hypothetical protein
VADNDLREFFARHPNMTMLAAVAGFFIVLVVVTSNIPPLPPENQPEARAAAISRLRDLCTIRSICSKYASARQECATAGNFDQCMKIKMGDDAWKVGSCTSDGNYRNAPPDMPGRVRCLGLGIP